MTELSITTLATASVPERGYVPLAAIPAGLVALPAARLAASGIPAERLMVWAERPDSPDMSERVLAALGRPATPQQLFLVRSGPPRDAMVAELAGLVHRTDWTGEDLGITHLEELGGTAVFGLLDWAMDAEATVVVCDEPALADERAGGAVFAAVGLRVVRGPGPLRVLGCGEGTPQWTARRFTGGGPCDAWQEFARALAAGEIDDGEPVLLHTRGPVREGWLALRAVDAAAIRPVSAGLAGVTGGGYG